MIDDCKLTEMCQAIPRSPEDVKNFLNLFIELSRNSLKERSELYFQSDFLRNVSQMLWKYKDVEHFIELDPNLNSHQYSKQSEADDNCKQLTEIIKNINYSNYMSMHC